MKIGGKGGEDGENIGSVVVWVFLEEVEEIVDNGQPQADVVALFGGEDPDDLVCAVSDAVNWKVTETNPS